ncbi:MAG: hypothetical protein U9Q98_01655 [Bacteroidota bacterium]|nr:hypothetical protein [Bacteroidota bacterium]
MELRINIRYEQILNLVKQLSYNDKKKLKTEVEDELFSQKRTPKILDNESIEFRKFLLQGPIMADEQFENYKQLRKNFNQWIEK